MPKARAQRWHVMRRTNDRFGEITALEQQRFTESPGERAGKAVAEIQSSFVSAVRGIEDACREPASLLNCHWLMATRRKKV